MVWPSYQATTQCQKSIRGGTEKYKMPRVGQPLNWLRTIDKDFDTNPQNLQKYMKVAYYRRQNAELVESVSED